MTVLVFEGLADGSPAGGLQFGEHYLPLGEPTEVPAGVARDIRADKAYKTSSASKDDLPDDTGADS